MRNPSRTTAPVAACAVSLCFLASAGGALQGKRPAPGFRFDDLARARRLGGIAVAPDGRSIACAVSIPDVEANRSRSAIWLVPSSGGEPRRLTSGEKGDAEPRFAPDGRRVAFLSDREGGSQIWSIDLAGGEPRKETAFATEVNAFRFSPDGKRFVFTSDVFPDCADSECQAARAARREKASIRARVAESLLFRHWNAWKNGLRTHVWSIPVGGGRAVDLTPGGRDAPRFEVGGGTEFDVSPEGEEVLFASIADKQEALSTNADLFTVPLSGGAPVNRTAGNPAFDGGPRYSPDGKWIAYRLQKRPGYEADRFRLALLNRSTGQSRVLTEDFDAWVEEIAWAPDSRAIYFTTELAGRGAIERVEVAGARRREVWKGGGAPAHLSPSPDGSRLYFTASSLTHPAEIHVEDTSPTGAGAGRADTALTHWNDGLVSPFSLAAEERWTESRDGRRLHGWLFRPPDFDPSRKYPAVLLIHGGPQGAWTDAWSYRWNPQVFAGSGYVVYAANPRGSTGFGQDFTDAIRGDWGGGVYDDLMRQTDDLASLPYVDKTRIGAAGASFGGYMVAWMAGHTDRFAALVCHDGVTDAPSMALETEELWFPVWEFRGWPWSSEDYQKWSPIRFAEKFQTPTLVVHGELDYRVPFGQGLELFTALQVRNVPSKLLTFPDEGHWVLKPGNSRVWHATVLDWLHRWLGGAAADPAALAAIENVSR